jgi:DivIVA domain-containing protein
MTDLASPSSVSTSTSSSLSLSSTTPRGETSSEFSPSAISQRRFGTAFRGLDADEVRTYLQRVSSHLKGLHEQIAGLTTELDAARSARVVDLTQSSAEHGDSAETPTRSVEEQQVIADAESAARALLDDAQREAKAIIDRANDESGRILLRARAESRGKQPDGSRVLVGDAAVPDGSSSGASASTPSAAGPRGVAAMAAGTGEAMFDAPDDPDAARLQARAMIQEARAVRERILTDLGKRRRTAHVQLEQLRVAREKLQETLREARRVIDASSRDVTHAEVEARLAAEAAGRRVNAEPMPTVEQLEVEVMGGRHMSVFRPNDLPRPDAEEITASAVVLDDEHDDVVEDPTVPLRVEDLVEDGLLVLPESVSEHTEVASSDQAAHVETAVDSVEAVEVLAVVASEEVSVDATTDLVVEPVIEAGVETVDDAVQTVDDAVPEDVSDVADASSIVASSIVDDTPVPEVTSAPEVTSPEEGSSHAATDIGDAPKSASKAKGSMTKSTKPTRKKKNVDDVFARIRAEREEAGGHSSPQVNHGTSALAPVMVDVPKPHVQTPEVPEVAISAETLTPPSVGDANDDAATGDRESAILERRNHDMELLQLRVSKQLKRYLQDEHSAALSSVRRARGKLTVDALLDTAEVQHARAAAVVAPALIEAGQAGVRAAESYGFSSDVVLNVDAHAERMASDLLDPIRSVLQSALDAHSADIPAILGQAFREWNTDRLGRHVRDILSASFAAGLVGAVPNGIAMHWLVDHGDEPSPDCDDNALAGTVTNGETFPTGHSAPPLGPGCRCLVVPRRASSPVVD